MVAKLNETRKKDMGKISIQMPIPPSVLTEGSKGYLFPGVSKFTGQGRIMGKTTPLSTGKSVLGVPRKKSSNLFSPNWAGSRTGGYRDLKSKFRPGGRRGTGGTGFAPGGRIAAALRGE